MSVVQNPKLLPLQGKTIAEIAKMWGKDPIDAIFDLLIEDNAFTMRGRLRHVGAGCRRWRSSSPGFQSTTIRRERRPTAFWAASIRIRALTARSPRILRKYVREEHKLRLEDAIRKFSALPAQRMRFADRGVLKQGMWADIVVFDPETIHDVATFEKPNQLSVGMQYVLVNGSRHQQRQDDQCASGKVLRGPAYRPSPASAYIAPVPWRMSALGSLRLVRWDGANPVKTGSHMNVTPNRWVTLWARSSKNPAPKGMHSPYPAMRFQNAFTPAWPLVAHRV